MAIIQNERLGRHWPFRLSEATAGDYFALLKPRVMSLVVFTAFVGLAATPVAVNPVQAMIAVLAIAVGAGASGALNMWYDADIDGRMRRTASPADPRRPGAAGRGARPSAWCSPSSR